MDTVAFAVWVHRRYGAFTPYARGGLGSMTCDKCDVSPRPHSLLRLGCEALRRFYLQLAEVNVAEHPRPIPQNGKQGIRFLQVPLKCNCL